MAAALIIDDDAAIRMMFARALQSVAETEQAASGAEALRLLHAKKYDVLILDLHMPVIDGFVILQMLTTKPGPNRDTPVIVVTADTSDKARVQALERHAAFMLTKPVPIATLVALVASTLKRTPTRTSAPPSSLSSRPLSLGPPSSLSSRPVSHAPPSSIPMSSPPVSSQRTAPADATARPSRPSPKRGDT